MAIQDRERERFVQAIRLEIGAEGLSLDDVLYIVAELRKDSERLAFLYSGKTTASNSLIDAELRLFNNNPMTLDEVREAIDEAMRTPFVQAVGAA